jgi:5-methyltetrahydropteroyltriglutamate--homocysteine methyltransferase
MGQGFGAIEYYQTQDEFEEAMCDALRVEYEAIVNAGIVLQFDCNWGVLSRVATNSVEAVRNMIAQSIERINYASRNIDPDMMRIHLCWGAVEAPTTKTCLSTPSSI